MSVRRARGPAADLRVRRAQARDAEAIRSIYNEAVRSTTATFDTSPRTAAAQREWFSAHQGRYPVLVAELDRAVIGWVALSPWSDRPAYEGTVELSVYVASSHRRRGVGTALMQEILRAGARRRVRTVLARVAGGNPASRALHLKAGFVPVGVMHRVGKKFGHVLDVELLEFHWPAEPTPPE